MERTTVNVGIIGLGILGSAVARHLLDSGFKISVYNRTRNKTKQFEEKRITIASTPKELAKISDLVIIVVKDANAVNEVSFGKNGIIEGKHKNLIVADMSTISPTDSKDIASKFKENDIQKLDIPVMGGPNVAITGELVMMVSGEEKTFDLCKSVFEIVANRVFFLGENGTANSVKLAMNLQITMLAMALSEGITLVKNANVDPKIFLKILNSTYFKTGMSEKKAFKMIEGDCPATFTLRNLKKDISTMVDFANQLKIRLPMTEKAEEIYEDAVREGFGDIDYTGIINYIKKIKKTT